MRTDTQGECHVNREDWSNAGAGPGMPKMLANYCWKVRRGNEGFSCWPQENMT